MDTLGTHGQGSLPLPPPIGPPFLAPRRRLPPWIRQFGLPAVLFLMTVGTTALAGAWQLGLDPLRHPAVLVRGLPFAATLLLILLAHEFAHYVTARRYGLPTSLPYFLPVPSFIGTFGAFIRIHSPILQRRALIDIGASGPLVGFGLSLVAVAVGLAFSTVVEESRVGGLMLGEPLIFTALSRLVLGALPAHHDVLLHPIAFAGWIGLFVTALNLIPIGQLDGGHVAYAVLGTRQGSLAILMVGVLLGLGFGWPGWGGPPTWSGWPGWYLWAGLTAVLGVRHPPVADAEMALDRRRTVIGWLALLVFVLTFTPKPFAFGEGP